MRDNFDIKDFVNVLTEEQALLKLVERFKKRRKELNLTQRELSVRSGVTYSSIRRFETKGEISLTSLIKLSNAIDSLHDFNELFKNKKITSIRR